MNGLSKFDGTWFNPAFLCTDASSRLPHGILVVAVGKHQWQHYLPQVYLAGFARSTGDVWRYDRAEGCLKALGVPIIGAERDLYSLITGEELSHEIETRWFNPLDGRFGPILRKLEDFAALSSSQLSDLANFVAYLRVRTPAMIREMETTLRVFDTFVGEDQDSMTYHSKPSDDAPNTYVASQERRSIVPSKRDIGARRNEVLKLLVEAGMEMAQALLQLDWTILVAPRARSFIVGDNPFSIVPTKSHDLSLEGIGPMMPGASTFIPLSSRICLRMTNGGDRPARKNVDGNAVRAINSCQVLNSERYLFGPSDMLLRRLISELVSVSGLNSAQVVLREAPSTSDPSRSLLHSFTQSKIGPEWSLRVPID